MVSKDTMVICTAGALCSATIMAIVAMATPEWIVQNLHGKVTYGLTHECYEKPFSPSKDLVCEPYSQAPGEWSTTLVFLVFGTVALTGAAYYSIQAFTDVSKLAKSKIFGMAASVIFSLAALIFPGGFDYYQIGGMPYRLPDNAQIGYSYTMFVVTLGLIFVSQLTTMKILFDDFLP